MDKSSPSILIIGGPDKASCYSEKGITRVAYHPLEVLRLGHLYEYDVVIFWPSWVNDFELNMTKGELRKACPAFVTYYDIMSEQYHQYLSIPNPKDGETHIDLNGLELPGTKNIKRKDEKKKSKLDAPKIRPFDVTKDLPDSDKNLDYTDYKRLQKLFNDKLLEIMAGISQRQLAFIIVPSTGYGGQHPDEIIEWMKLPIPVEFDTERTNIASFTATGQHPIYTIMKGMTAIVKEWAFRFIACQAKDEYNNHLDHSDIDIDIPLPLNDYALTIRDVHATVRVGHTDGGGFARSLMILSEQGGLAFIPEVNSLDKLLDIVSSSGTTICDPKPKSIDTLVELIAKSNPDQSQSVAENVVNHNDGPKRSLVLTAERKPENRTKQKWKIILDGNDKWITAGQFSKVLLLVLAKLFPDDGFDGINGSNPKIRGISVRKLLTSWPTHASKVYDDAAKAIGRDNLIKGRLATLKEDWRTLRFMVKEINITPLVEYFGKSPEQICDFDVHNLLVFYKDMVRKTPTKK